MTSIIRIPMPLIGLYVFCFVQNYCTLEVQQLSCYVLFVVSVN